MYVERKKKTEAWNVLHWFSTIHNIAVCEMYLCTDIYKHNLSNGSVALSVRIDYVAQHYHPRCFHPPVTSWMQLPNELCMSGTQKEWHVTCSPHAEEIQIPSTRIHHWERCDSYELFTITLQTVHSAPLPHFTTTVQLWLDPQYSWNGHYWGKQKIYIYVQCNREVRLCKHSCRAKAVCWIFWVCVFSLSDPAVNALYYIFIRGVSGSATIFVLPLKQQDFWEKIYWT